MEESPTIAGKLLRELPRVETLIRVGYLNRAADKEFAGGAKILRSMLDWTGATSTDATLLPEPVPFDHPLWIVYSSGTTGLPKPIVQGRGGILLEHLKLTALHNDIGAGDRFHWFSSTAWVMWNIQVSGLLVGATICLYDGNPAWPDLGALWRFVGETGATFFGAGAAFFASCIKAIRRRSLILGACAQSDRPARPCCPTPIAGYTSKRARSSG